MQLTKFRIALILTTVLLLVSCKTPQQIAVQDQQHLQENVRAQEQQLHSLQQQVNLLQSQMTRQQTGANRRTENDESDVSETVTEEFDTTQPVDSATGTPPLKSRRTEKRDRKAQSVATETEETHTEQQTGQQLEIQHSAEDSITAQSDVEREKESRTNVKQKTGLNWWQTTLCTIGGACILAFLIWLAIKILKRYVKPF